MQRHRRRLPLGFDLLVEVAFHQAPGANALCRGYLFLFVGLLQRLDPGACPERMLDGAVRVSLALHSNYFDLPVNPFGCFHWTAWDLAG